MLRRHCYKQGLHPPRPLPFTGKKMPRGVWLAGFIVGHCRLAPTATQPMT